MKILFTVEVRMRVQLPMDCSIQVSAYELKSGMRHQRGRIVSEQENTHQMSSDICYMRRTPCRFIQQPTRSLSKLRHMFGSHMSSLSYKYVFADLLCSAKLNQSQSGSRPSVTPRHDAMTTQLTKNGQDSYQNFTNPLLERRLH